MLGLFNDSKEIWDENKKTGKMSEDEIENLISKRNEARSKKDFKTSDEIRNLLNDHGIEINDKDGQTEWKYK